MNRNPFYLAIIVFLLVGCHQRENMSQLKAVNRSLEFTNTIIFDANKLVYEEFENKLKEPETRSQAQHWMPRAMLVKKYADDIKALIEKVKNDLIEQTDNLKKENAPVLKELYESNSIGFKIVDKLAALKDSFPVIFNVNEFIDKPDSYASKKRMIGQLRKALSLLPDYPDSLSTAQRTLYIKKWVEKNFTGSSPLMAMIILNKIEADVLTTEKALIDSLINQIGLVDGAGFYEVFRAVATLSSSYVKRGQPIEVIAGVGQFSNASKPRIIINGKEIKLDEEATAVYRFTAKGEPGKHRIPVKIEFTKSDGSRETIVKNCEYIIADK